MKIFLWAFNIIMSVLNAITVAVTLTAYLLPFLSPSIFPALSVFTFFMPVFFVLNLFFLTYWAVQLKKRLVFSAIVILLGITFFNKFYKFHTENYSESDNNFVVMTYNVRLFNIFNWLEKGKDIPNNILEFVNNKNPDILCIQEFSNSAKINFRIYKYQYILVKGTKIKTGQAIFSKFPIINKGSVDFQDSHNGLTFADIKIGKDTIRVYNMHLESIKISPDVHKIDQNINELDKDKSQMLFSSMAKAFKTQKTQVDIFNKHKNKCPYPIIICGDMNNTAFSYIYRDLKKDLKDCFEEAGTGFGSTYKFKYYPARIDYIFADPKMDVEEFKTFSDFENSDHFPIMTKLKLD